jgi:serine/threonine protein phosphatase PrpC
MTVWRSFGASIIGPAHIAAGSPNQDAWRSFHHAWGDGVVVSDGLGSKPLSAIGSRAACLAVVGAARECCGESVVDSALLFERIKSKWLSLVAPLDPRDCAATCIFAFRINDGKVSIGMLGDGLAAVITANGSVETLQEDKSGSFSNITNALSEDLGKNKWLWRSIQEDDCQSILLCTDGVSDDLTDVTGFVKEFCDEHVGLSSLSASRRVRETLEKWPTPKHSDDKTIACLLREEVAVE